MKLEFHNKLCNPQTVECTRVVIRDQYDNPIAVVIEAQDGMVCLISADSPEFHEMLQLLGIDNTVVVHSMDSNAERKLVLPNK